MQTDQQLIARARQLFESARIDEAEAAYARLAEQFPEEPGMRVMLGVCRKLKGDTDAALDHLNAAVELDEDFAEGHFHLGQTLIQLGRMQEAEPALKKAIVSNPNHVGARVALARLLHRDGRSDEAVEMLRSALRAEADSVTVLNELAQVLVDLGREDEADEHASRAVRLRPEDPRAQIAMARVFQARHQWDFAEQCLKNALDKAANSSPLWAALGSLYQQAGRDANAAAAFEQAEQVRQGAGLEPAVMLAFARSLQAVGRTTEARKRLESLVGRYAFDGEVLLLLAELRLAEGDRDGAGALVPRLEQSSPSAARLVEAWLAEAADDRETAARLASALHDDDNAGIDRRARLVSGRCALAAGDRPAGDEALRPILESEPTAAWLLAEIHRVAARPESAREILENHLAKFTGAGEAHLAMTHSRLAWLLDELGDHEAAAAHLQRTEWQGLPMPAELVGQMPDSLPEAMLETTGFEWSDDSVDDGRPVPVFVLGWPGSGREPIIEALVKSGLQQLPAGDFGRRRRAIGLPLAPNDLSAQTDASVRMVRRRYFRGADSSVAFVLEPGWFEATALPALARFFPNARIILPLAEFGDLELHWRLSGYGKIEQILKACQWDQEVLEHLRDKLSLTFVEIPRTALTDHPTKAAEPLAGLIDLDASGDLASALEKALGHYPIKPEGHWRQYTDVLVSGRGEA